MSIFRKIKKKRDKVKKRDREAAHEVAAIIALVENYREKRPGDKISIDQAYIELEKLGFLSKI
jgi:hypothetical protein